MLLMGKHCRLLFTFLFLSLIPAVAFAAVEPDPILDAVQNYCGPILVFWNTSGAIDPGTQYYVFISTSDMASNDPATLFADPTIFQKIVPYTSGTAMRATVTTYLGAALVDGQTYNFRVAARNAGTWSAHSSSETSATCVIEDLAYSSVVPSVDGVFGSAINYDSSTLRVSIDLRGADDSAPFLPVQSFSWDIKTNDDGNTIFLTDKENANINIVVSSSNYSANAVITWDGSVPKDKGNKHNGNYRFDLWVKEVDSKGAVIFEGWDTDFLISVNVVHINTGKGLVYQVLGTGQPSYGPPFKLDYYMSKDSFVTWKIFDHTGAAVRTVVNAVPRVCGDGSTNPGDWNKNVNDEIWDGRNDKGFIVPNDIYTMTFDAYSYSGLFSSSYSHALTAAGTISFNVLRIVDIASTGITDTAAVAHIKYTLAGANSTAGGATIKIVICTPGTTYYMASTAGSMAYLNGASTYTYTVGDPVPTVAANLKKVFVFARSAGSLDETWNGFDDSGVALPNANYVFAISGTDDSGNHAIDNSGNNGIIIGNITIDRTAAQTSTDSTPPSVTGISVGGTNMSLAGGAVLTSPFASLSVAMSDAGGSGVDLTGSMVMLTGPTTNTITVTTSNNGTDTIILAFAQQTTNGTYTMRIRPRDKVGNTASDVIYNFTLNISASGVSTAFAQSTFAYPNPVKCANFVTFAFTVNAPSTMKLEVYNILGELLYQENWLAAQTGAQTKTWGLVNQSNNKLATGVYLYRLSSSSISTMPKFQKLIIIQ